jgi:hypothetical protein
MDETTAERIGRHAEVAFVTAVTAALLALTLYHARRGLSALPNAAVYALMVGFGLEYLRSVSNGGYVR